MWDKLKSHSVVVVITVFIWLVADQNVREEQSFQIPIRVNSRDPDRYAALAEPPYQIILDATLAGRRRHLKDFADLINSRQVLEALVDEGKLSSSQPQSISAEADILGRIKEFKEARLVVESVTPRTVAVLIDDYETVPNLAVEPNYGDLKVIADPSPAKISIRLPEFAAATLKADPVFRPNVEQRIREARGPDNSFEIRVPVSFDFENLDPQRPIKVTPADEITIIGRIESLTETRRKGPIQITWSIPDEAQLKYVVAVKSDQSLRQDIDITGPKGQVDQLPVQKIRGFVDIMAGDEPNKEITRAVRYVLPEGFSLASDPAQQEITFTLLPRSPGSPVGGG
jgi:hypothetical protein